MSNIDKQALRDEVQEWKEIYCEPADAENLKFFLGVESLLDELEAAERERDNWRNSFDNERFRADKLAESFKAEHEQLVMSNGALITQHMRANGAKRRAEEIESNPIATLDVQSGRDDGNKFALVYSSAAHKLPDDVYYLCAVPAAAGKGE